MDLGECSRPLICPPQKRNQRSLVPRNTRGAGHREWSEHGRPYLRASDGWILARPYSAAALRVWDTRTQWNVRTRGIVMGNPRLENGPEMGFTTWISQFKHSRRMLPITRSQFAFGFGQRGGDSSTFIPSLAVHSYRSLGGVYLNLPKVSVSCA